MNKVQLNSLCRVCLCKNSEMFPLNYTFREATESVNNENEDDNIVIQHALSALFNYKETDSEKFPKQICSMCLGILKIAYDFKILFEESHQIILQYIGQHIAPKDCANNTTSSSVDLIVGTNKYDLKDLVIVEPENCREGYDFGGFLRNLGTQVTATFSESYKKSGSTIKEIVREHCVESYKKSGSSIEKILGENCVESDKKSGSSVDKIVEENCVESYKKSGSSVEKIVEENSVESEEEQDDDEYIVIESDKINDTIIHVIHDDREKNTDTSQKSDNCDELIISAMNLRYECSVCQKLYRSKARFEKHIVTCDQTLIPNLQCQHCSKFFSCSKSLRNHLKLHDKKQNISCDFCDQKFNTSSSLKYHQVTKHSETSYVCQVCGKKFAIATTLNAHMQVHNKNKTQCICPVCGKTFHYKGGLFYHMKQHTNERKYHCDYCEKTFYTLTAKKRHTLTHTGARPYQCQFCPKRFFSTGEMKKHEYIHAGVLPYKCKYCSKGFRSNFNMKVHWFNHTGSSVCEYCYRGFISKEVLQFHYRVKHKNLVQKKKDT
ncbi:zinc finger protein 62 homolog [Diorhabda carinulata]|uniref:zinc finger protein 62 homolog n=1 Tax=Diorhabda carinulata TaxID=1163345 RepID=UPI0025A16E08|nr:zinc finger protein 62 homolog [Diorhabda carinulata]